MNALSKNLLFWTPRSLSVAFAVFLGLFALDVFNEHYGMFKTLLALLIHLAPALAVLLILIIAWRWEWVGAAAYATLALWYAQGNWRRHADWVLIIAAPVLVIAALFLANWLKHDELRAKP
jgi:ABC-type dipeptide/oligopeptide/nickel transport system permease component